MRFTWLLSTAAAAALAARAGAADSLLRIKTEAGELEGVLNSVTGVHTFKGIPYAAPPVGDLRWKPPQLAARWQGVRKAERFGPRAMQLPVFGDMVFRSDGMSEDCLYLNVWTPARGARERLPILVYFYGGGFVAGDGSEPRYDGESMARKGIVAVTVNYRLGIFGFFAHPELTRESPHNASGNYGLLDQAAALQWIRRNISAFGGDPKRVTIAGESAGSFSVCGQMASPLSRGLIAGAIGESGAMFGETLRLQPRAAAERNGEAFAREQKADSLSALRAIPAEKLLEATRTNPFQFSLCVDGYFLPKPPAEIYAAGEQAHVPLLAGWNAAETPGQALLANGPKTAAAFAAIVRTLYGSNAETVLKAYPPAQWMESATALASDRFIAYGTWKWLEMHARTGGKPVYRYLFVHPRPGEAGAFHAVEIEYALGNLNLNPKYAWSEEDRKTSAAMQEYFANFIKRGDPGGPGLPRWPAYNRETPQSVMRLDAAPRAEPDSTRTRYETLDSLSAPRR